MLWQDDHSNGGEAAPTLYTSVDENLPCKARTTGCEGAMTNICLVSFKTAPGFSAARIVLRREKRRLRVPATNRALTTDPMVPRHLPHKKVRCCAATTLLVGCSHRIPSPRYLDERFCRGLHPPDRGRARREPRLDRLLPTVRRN